MGFIKKNIVYTKEVERKKHITFQTTKAQTKK